MMIGRRYWTRQAMTLLKFASLTKNPEFAAVLIEKAADLKSQVDDANPPKDVSPRALSHPLDRCAERPCRSFALASKPRSVVGFAA